MTALYTPSPEQDELRGVLRSMLEVHAAARGPYDDRATVPAPGLLARLVELGITGLGVPEADGGSGGAVLDQLVVAEELGRAVAPVGYVAGAVVAAALAPAAPGEVRSRVLAGLASGEVRAGVALDGPGLTYDSADAHVLLVGVGEGVGLVEAPVVEPQPSVDRTRPLSACRWAEDAVVALDTPARVGALVDLQRTLYAAEAVGVAAAALDATAAYTRDRRQFGLPIGTFQAVKHRLADMLVRVECGRSAAVAAAWAIHDGADATLAAHMAQAVATEAAIEVVSAAIQLHGGIGVTWDHDLHLHLRRAKGLELAHGSPGWHHEQIALALLGPAEAR